MDPAQRLADLLAGELTVEESAQLRAQIAADPQLRRQLEALRRADGALKELESPRVPDGFDERLHAHLDETLQELMETSPSRDPGDPGPDDAAEPMDELARRRQLRTSPRWLIGGSAVAAAFVIVAGVGVVLNQGRSGSDDSGVDATAAMSADEAITESAQPLPFPVIDEGRELDEAAIGALVDGSQVMALPDPNLDEVTAAQLRADVLTTLRAGDHLEVPLAGLGEGADTDSAEMDQPGGLDTDDGPLDGTVDDGGHDIEDDSTAFDDHAADDGDDAADDGPAVSEERPSESGTADDPIAAVARCLAVLLPESPTAIPTYSELATYEGEDVVVIGLVDRDPPNGTLSRRELWIFSRVDCEVRHFAQS